MDLLIADLWTGVANFYTDNTIVSTVVLAAVIVGFGFRIARGAKRIGR